MNSIFLTVNSIPPSWNKIMRMHWAERSEIQENWDMAVMISKREAVQQELKRLPYRKCEIEICYHFKNKRSRDYDNYSGKFILDALKHNQVIVDDNSKVVTKLSHSFSESDQDKTIIFIKSKE